MVNEGDAVGKRIGNCPFFSAIWEQSGKLPQVPCPYTASRKGICMSWPTAFVVCIPDMLLIGLHVQIVRDVEVGVP